MILQARCATAGTLSDTNLSLSLVAGRTAVFVAGRKSVLLFERSGIFTTADFTFICQGLAMAMVAGGSSYGDKLDL
jgi:hypothetical protein